MTRYVCQFSCGAASAVATKLTLRDHSDVLIVNAFLAAEHPDNRRFATDCERWFGKPIVILRDDKYGALPLNVWRAQRFIKNRNGAPCSRVLKRDLLRSIEKPGDVKVLGFTNTEKGRFENLQEMFPEEEFEAPLIANNLSKEDCLALISRAGIPLPAMYLMGYHNANCIGCPKGGQNYWQKIRRDFPQQFAEMVKLQDELGPGAGFLRFRSGILKDERMVLRDLPPGGGNLADEASFECSFICEVVEDLINEV